jgi:ferric-dicitrate binding protein FerR (iron transport regulator)
VEQWSAADPANRRELEAMLAIWSAGRAGPEPGGPSGGTEVDVDAAWRKVKARIDASDERGKVIPLWRPMLRWAAAAAVIVGLFALGRFLMQPQGSFVASAENVKATLQDSTRVILSPGSQMDVRMGDERRIAMSGKAWFEVARDEQHAFIVRTEDMLVTVLGTGFEVNAYDSAQVWSVRVRHGRVRVEAGGDQVELREGERVSFDRKSGLLQRGKPVTVETWGERIVRFENAPMSEVTQELQRMYHVRVDLSNDVLRDCRLTTTFDDQTIEEVLQVISIQFTLQVSRLASDHYVLIGDACQ